MRSTNTSLLSALVCLGLFAVSVGPALAQSDSQVGVWKLNVEKSTFSPGPKPTSGTTTIEAAGAGTKVSVDQTLPDGTKRQYSFTARLRWQRCSDGRQSRRGHGRAHTHRRVDRADGFEEGRKSDDHSNIHGVERWEDTDGDDQGGQCQGAAGQQRRGLRAPIARPRGSPGYVDEAPQRTPETGSRAIAWHTHSTSRFSAASTSEAGTSSRWPT